MKKLIFSFLAAVGVTIVAPLTTFAHVVVTPKQAIVGDHVSFSLSVPNEREVAVSKVKLVIPKGVTDVQPDVTAGWTITTETSGDEVRAITWSGTIPQGQRADFEFTAQVPAQTGEVDWKAYQTYADNTLVSWDQTPSADETDNDAVTSGPYSVTHITNEAVATTQTDSQSTLAIVLSIVAIVFSAIALLWHRRK